MDRSGYPVKKLRLQDEGGKDDHLASLTPAERIQMVWPLTLAAWAFKDKDYRESRLRRDVVRTVRGGR